jgi:hypothetical protein
MMLRSTHFRLRPVERSSAPLGKGKKNEHEHEQDGHLKAVTHVTSAVTHILHGSRASAVVLFISPLPAPLLAVSQFVDYVDF